MALFTQSASPAVVVKEVDLTGGVPNVQSSTGAMVGSFRWGPVAEATKVSSETELAGKFGNPDDTHSVDFHTVSQFLRYSGSAYVVREISSEAKNSYVAADGSAVPVVKNEDHFNSIEGSLDSDGHTFIAKYPGIIGNSIKVSMCPASTSDTVFDGWTYNDSFDGAPGTSDYASDRTATDDEVHVAIVDADGALTGTVGAVIETFPYLSLASDAKTTDGSSNYIKNVINNKSLYVWMAGFTSDYVIASAGTPATASKSFLLSSPAVNTDDLSAGVDSTTLGTTEILRGFDLYEDVDTILVDFLIAPQISARVDHTTVVNDLIATAQQTRKDCMVVASPSRTDVVDTSTPVTDTIAASITWTRSSYMEVDNNFLRVYDKYNDKYITIPAASSTAGIMASTDTNFAPWFSPAGARRGQYLGITSIAYSPTKSERDTLYKAGINSIANIPGQGVLLYGDKTFISRPSAFDRINVRRLFLVLERAIAEAGRNALFEFNDEFTRAEFVNVVEPTLREVQGRRGITDFKVVCDETNNTAEVVDRNEFIASIFIKPARSINFVTLNFVATRTGASFEEVVGTV